MESEHSLPNKEKIQQLYESYGPVFAEVLNNVERKLKSTVRLTSMPTYKARIKSFGSYYKKILRQKPQQAARGTELVPLTDMMGIRVICAFLEDLAVVEQQLLEHFSVQEVERKGADQSFREFGYESVHVLISIPEDCLPKKALSPVLPPDVVCEIQIRTILQDAWAEVEHELIYKSEFNPFDKPLRRKLASINASLSLADTIFQEIRDYQTRLQSELGIRRNTFYGKADDITDREFNFSQQNLSPVAITAPEGGSERKPSIDDLVLSALHLHNTGDFSGAVTIYTQILEIVPPPPAVVMSVIYKHRGMAYFAQSEYDKALADFIKSTEHDPKAFRSLYYEGIVYSVLGKNAAAIDCYTRSLAIDSYQSHVYYRRALALYNEGQYAAATQDVKAALDLGLHDEDIKALQSKLMQKFDMKV